MRNQREIISISPHTDYGLCKLPDCVDLRENGNCARLNIDACRGSECSFMQTKNEAEKSAQRWCKRLSSLDESEQKQIAKKYYGGTKPWESK